MKFISLVCPDRFAFGGVLSPGHSETKFEGSVGSVGLINFRFKISFILIDTKNSWLHLYTVKP